MQIKNEQDILFCKFNILVYFDINSKNVINNFTDKPYKFIQNFYRVPEIGEEPSGKNILFGNDGLPEFNNFTIENCIAGIGHQALDVEKSIKEINEKLEKDEISSKQVFEQVIIPIEQVFAPMEATWGVAKTLYLGNSSLMPTKSYLSIHERARKAASLKFNNPLIFKAVEAAKKETTDEEQTRVLEKFSLEGRLNGLNIEKLPDRVYLGEIRGKLNVKRTKFREHVETAIKLFQHNIHDANLVKEFPPHLLQSIAVDQKQPTKGPWKVTLQPHIMRGFFEYCPHHEHKWNVWQADTRKASGYTDKGLANSTLLEEIRGLRQDQAKLLGFKSYADMSMETKMVGSVENLENILNTLLESARPVQEKEISELIDFAEQNGMQHRFEIFDIPYWRRRQQLEKFSYDEEALRDYFPSTKVVNGMFDLVERMFGVTIAERPGVTVWDEEVKYYDIFDGEDAKEPIAGFYIDLFSRDEDKFLVKENTGWMVALRNKTSQLNSIPLASLIFGFPAPIYGKPSLLSLRDIQLLFFKFGQALQHLLTRANYNEIAGLSTIDWDVVEVSGNLMTHLLYDAATLKSISCHYSTDEPISDTNIAAIQNARHHFAGFDLCEELYLSNLDLKLHKTKEFWLEIVKQLYPQHFVFQLDKRDAHPCSFLPAIAGDYGAAYFSHLYAKMIAADVYSAFEETKRNNPVDIVQIGKRFRDTFLAHGGSEEVFRRFRGRDPSPKALLKTIEPKASNKNSN